MLFINIVKVGCILISPHMALSILRMAELFKPLQEVNRFDSFCPELLLISQIFVSNKHFIHSPPKHRVDEVIWL